MSSCLHDVGATCAGPHRPRLPASAGLTLLEVLIAGAVSMILIVSVYAVYSASSRGYQVHRQVLGAQQQVRFGMDQLVRDVSLAGFLGTPDSQADPNVCPKPAGRLRGVVIQEGGPTNGNPRLVPQSITLFGAFWSQVIYFSESAIGNQVVLQSGATGAPFPATEEEFDRIFTPGRFLRIVNADQFEMYVPIQNASFQNRLITLQSPLPTAVPPDFCGVQGLGVGLEVNVVGYVRYSLQLDPGEQGKVDLIREEIDGSDPALARVVNRSAVRVAEYVADLTFLDFTLDVDRTRRQPTLQVLASLEDLQATGNQLLDLSDAARPQDLRAVTVMLTTRTQEEDESFPFVARATRNDPLDSYEVDPAMRGSARTVTMAQRVTLPSFAVRNVK
ncbi:MAG TPA: hypothetical protein PLQ97_02045 [Myxococcota bacterium]|nr:hypothetical protein [Myxococcota bacterium]HQK50330.1 hypothetical protein [Myxococcota bacterium]